MVKFTRAVIQDLRLFEMKSLHEKTVERFGDHGVPFWQSDDQLIASVATAELWVVLVLPTCDQIHPLGSIKGK